MIRTPAKNVIRRIQLIGILFSMPGLLVGGQALAAQNEAEEIQDLADDNSKRCINIRSLKRTEVVNDLSILFYMPGKKIYHNILPRRCSGLARERRFSYEVRSGSLCRMDMIRVLYDSGPGLRPGAACSLGMFHLVSQEDADAIRDKSVEGPHPEPIPLPEPEEIGADHATDPTENT